MMHLPHHQSVRSATKSSLAQYGTTTVKNCEDLLQEISETKQQMEDFDFFLEGTTQLPEDIVNDFEKKCQVDEIHPKKAYDQMEKDMQDKFELKNQYLQSYDKLIDNRIELLEKQQCMGFLEEMIPTEARDRSETDLSFTQNKINKKFHTLLGLVPTKNFLQVRKIMFRISRENIVMKSKNLNQIKDSFLKNKKPEEKTLIFMLFPKTEHETLIQQINVILSHYGFQEIEIPEISSKNEVYLSIQNELDENAKILNQTQAELKKIFTSFRDPQSINRVSEIHLFEVLVRREESYAKHLVFIEEKNDFNVLLFWTSKEYRTKLLDKLKDLNKDDQNFVPPIIEEVHDHNLKPPTKFRINEFTWPFQEIVDTYGIPRYGEVNPGLFTIVSFPFLFGLMFGDIGHGLLLLSFGIFLLSIKHEPDSMLNKVKYLFLLCGIFAVYCGFIYNEFFAVPFAVQPSCYEKVQDEYKRKSNDCVYAFGIDSIWGRSENETAFTNSFKMKFSIIVGVTQMLFGILLKGVNAVHFSKLEDLFFEAIPQFIFLAVTFGYMSFLIILKWLTNFDGVADPVSIIQVFINFFTVDQPLFPHQQNIQIAFTFVCLICFLMMLIPKPFVVAYKNKSKRGEQTSMLEDEEHKEQLIAEKEHQDEHENESFSELMVHQLIETIEFVLGSISNTASYLRLWALSLAHGQLAKVFMDMTFAGFFRDSSGFFVSFIGIVLGFAFFFLVTFAVIMIMDFMECMLHDLRLHWVEFQNKFFKGDGIKFKPFGVQTETNQQLMFSNQIIKKGYFFKYINNFLFQIQLFVCKQTIKTINIIIQKVKLQICKFSITIESFKLILSLRKLIVQKNYQKKQIKNQQNQQC